MSSALSYAVSPNEEKANQIPGWLAGFGCFHFLVISLSLSLSSTVFAKSLNDRPSIDRRIRLSEKRNGQAVSSSNEFVSLS
jgi:hypothetical protein